MSMRKQTIGKTGEDFAVWLLEGTGFKIVGRNERTRYGEIDIVAIDGETTVFIEVRTTTTRLMGGAIEALPRRKRSRVARQALYYIAEHRVRGDVRIDFIAHEQDGGEWRTTHFVNAFGRGGTS